MKTLFRAFLLCIFVNMASCQYSGNGTQSQASAQGNIKSTISVDEFEQKLSTMPDAQLIDVRTPEEYAGGHLKNALNINVRSDDFAQQVGKLDKKRPVMVYCKAGSRSAAAAEKMQEMGFVEIYDMSGGIMKWEGEGKPLDQGNFVNKSSGINMDSLNKIVVQSKYVLIDFNAKWCEPCKRMAPYLDSLSIAKKDQLLLVKLDADENKDLMKQKGISGLPCLELYKEGKLQWKHEGYISKQDLLKETNF